MRSLFDAMARHARAKGDAVALSDAGQTLTREAFLARIAGLAREIEPGPRVVGILAPNKVEWAIAELAGALAGKIVVPLPAFFSATQLTHIARDASIELILATEETWPQALQSGVVPLVIERAAPADTLPELSDGFGTIIYTSGSTGAPKGVRHESGQVAWSCTALAAATGASERDSYLSVLPLPLLLETICAIFVPVLVGAPVHFETRLAEALGRGSAAGLAAAVDRHRPTMSVVVPQLLKSWVGELMAAGGRAPDSLRFVAVGGAPVPVQTVEAAWDLGIPAHEGYGLSECCSVVSVNRPGEERAGTVGRPLDGLNVSIDDGEIVVDGPSITEGYLGQPNASRPWRTGDLGTIDADGFLSVHGRKDNLIITGFGRNVSPEWVETMLLGDERIALAAVFGHGEPHLTALIVPSIRGADWFAAAAEWEVLDLLAECCASAPDYAVPKAYQIVPLEQALARLVSSNGRIRRQAVRQFVDASSSQPRAVAL